MSTSDLPRHDSGVDADGSTQPSTLPLTHTPAPALPSQQSPEPEQRLQGESQDSSVTEAGDSESGDSESDDSDCDGSDCEHEDSGLDANGVHFCLDCYVRYLLKIKWAFRDRRRVFSEMESILTSYYHERLMTGWVVLRVNLLLAEKPRLLDKFYRFLPFEFQR